MPAAHEELETDSEGRHKFLGYIAQIGPWTLYHPNGRKKLDTTYRDGEQHGLTTHYYGNGSIFSQGHMDRGSRVGEWQTYGYCAKFPDK